MFCLTSNSEPSCQLPCATYSFFSPGLQTEKFPLRVPDAGGVSGKISFKNGSLTQKTPGRIEWDPHQLEPNGVELVFDLGEECVVSKMLLRHFTSPSEFKFHGDPHMSARGIRRIELTVFSPAAAGKNELMFQEESKTSLPEEIVFKTGGVRARELRIKLSGRGGVSLSSVEIWGDPVLAVYPTPQKMSFDGESYVLNKKTSVFVSGGEEALTAGKLLARRLSGKTGLNISVKSCGENSASLVVGEHPGSSLPGVQTKHQEGYALSSGANGVFVSAVSGEALFRASGTVERFLEKRDGKYYFRPAVIEDYPDTDMRGVHLFLPDRKNLPFFLRYLEYLSQGLKYNTVFLQLSPFMRFKSHPELEAPFRSLIAKARADLGRYNPNTLHDMAGGGEFVEQEEVLQIIAKCRETGVEVIPELQTMSHSAWYLTAHPEFAETPEEIALTDHCPSNPKTRVLVKELLDEAIALVKPKAVHIGHDEVRAIGKCPLCRGKNGAELFSRDVLWMYEYLKEKGIKTHMWSDHLIEKHNGSFSGSHLAAATLPKDIILHNWTPKSHMGSIDEQTALGFTEIIAGGYNTLFRDKPLQREQKGKSYRKGYNLTTWCGADPVSLGASGRGCLTNQVYAAESLWSPEEPAFETPLFWARVEDEVRRMRSEVIGTLALSGEVKQLSFPVSAYPNDERMPLDEIPAKMFSPDGVSFSVEPARALFFEHPAMRDKKYPVKSSLVPVGVAGDGLVFLLAIAGEGVRRAEGKKAGEFTIKTAGGGEYILPVVMNYNIGDLRRYANGSRSSNHPIPAADLAYLGPVGEAPGAIYTLSWKNPEPLKIIDSVSFETCKDGPAFILCWLGVSALIKEQK
jgi:hypothetical protein